MVSVKPLEDAVLLALSVALNVCAAAETICVGVPLIMPVDVLRLSPVAEFPLSGSR